MRERIYIGSYSDSIKIYNLKDGKLELINNVNGIKNPSYLHINKDVLYSVSETSLGTIYSFKIVKDTLKQIDLKEINQSLPCYITTDRERKNLLVANYDSGSIIMYKLNKDGSISKEKYLKRYDGSNMHFAEFIDNVIYGVDLGNDKIYKYDNKLEPLLEIKMLENSGPRHLVTSKDRKKIYIVTELSNEILTYEDKKKLHKYELIQRVSTLKNTNIKSYAGAIKISKDYKYIYVTNRGENSIAVFKIGKEKLEMIQNISSYGEFPRDILLNETEEYVLVANQKSNNIVIYNRNIKNGKLIKKSVEVNVKMPSCIVRSNYGI